ncbi:MAG TPA: peroxiredoxin [Paludibacter sp.]|nr:peroxiredoxin [Paludibacter sp.]
MHFILNNIWLILFVAWGLPLSIYRSKFRKIVYQTDNWVINIKPAFLKEIKGLFGNIYPDNHSYRKFRNFYRFYLGIYFVLFFFYFSMSDSLNSEVIGVGSTVPSFSLKDQNGKIFELDSVKGKKNQVIYFYPKDDTPGCTREACSFRDQFEVFKQHDALIIGISAQSVESHLEFSKKHRLNYTLLSDDGNVVRKLFGVPANLFGLLPGRVTYVVDKAGKVVFVFNSQMNAEKHIEEALRILKELK